MGYRNNDRQLGVCVFFGHKITSKRGGAVEIITGNSMNFRKFKKTARYFKPLKKKNETWGKDGFVSHSEFNFRVEKGEIRGGTVLPSEFSPFGKLFFSRDL